MPHRFAAVLLTLAFGSAHRHPVRRPASPATARVLLSAAAVAQGGERQMMVYFPAHRLLYTSDAFSRNPDGTFFTPEYLSQVVQSVGRERLVVDTVFGMHLDPTPWSAIVGAVRAAVREPPPAPTTGPALPVLLPGSSALADFAPDGATTQLRLYRRPPGADAVEARLADGTRVERIATGDSSDAIVLSEWFSPFDSRDSIVVTRTGLRPINEVTTSRGRRMRFDYDSNRVRVVIDSAGRPPAAYHWTFDQPVFAFSELELLVRSVYFRTGLRFVLPMFSEGDRAIEHDTLSVVGPTADANGRPEWIVEWADPAIVTTYVVDARSRTIVGNDTRQRKTGAHGRIGPANGSTNN